jgi:hypothetical protein
LLAIRQLLLTNSLLKMFMEQENERIARKDWKQNKKYYEC